ncbi:MAG: hypothetical protein ABSF54_09645 [Bryobacteraceae bacterium]|jgi:ABC-type Fe3+-siderophore transport system permease subunit
MSDARPKFTGINHTATVAFLIAVFIFSLQTLAVAYPFPIALCSLVACMALGFPAPSRSLQTIGTVE